MKSIQAMNKYHKHDTLYSTVDNKWKTFKKSISVRICNKCRTYTDQQMSIVKRSTDLHGYPIEYIQYKCLKCGIKLYFSRKEKLIPKSKSKFIEWGLKNDNL